MCLTMVATPQDVPKRIQTIRAKKAGRDAGVGADAEGSCRKPAPIGSAHKLYRGRWHSTHAGATKRNWIGAATSRT